MKRFGPSPRLSATGMLQSALVFVPDQLSPIWGSVRCMLAASLWMNLLGVVQSGGATLQVPQGMQEITLAVVLLLILVYRPQGIIGDRELGLAAAK